MKLIMIAAIGKNRELGKDNDLIWHFKEDMKYFREHTTGHTILMGRKTFDSLPKVLPNRHHIVISHSNPELPEDVDLFHSLDAFFKAYQDKDEEIYVIGGAQMYTQFLPYADCLLLTEIEDEATADVYFPDFNKDEYRKTIESTIEEKGITFHHVRYEKEPK